MEAHIVLNFYTIVTVEANEVTLRAMAVTTFTVQKFEHGISLVVLLLPSVALALLTFGISLGIFTKNCLFRRFLLICWTMRSSYFRL